MPTLDYPLSKEAVRLLRSARSVTVRTLASSRTILGVNVEYEPGARFRVPTRDESIIGVDVSPGTVVEPVVGRLGGEDKAAAFDRPATGGLTLGVALGAADGALESVRLVASENSADIAAGVVDQRAALVAVDL